MGGLKSGKSIDKETVQYGLSLGKKIKAAKVDDIDFANKIQSWGVNYIITDYIHPFLIKNDKEEPIIVRCIPSVDNEYNSECEIDNDIILRDNEIYNIYYSDNIYNISEDINDIPIGEFQYIDTNILEELYYNVVNFNFKKGILRLNISENLKRGEEIMGIVGPAYDNVAECYQYNFICQGNNSKTVDCKIQKDDEDKVEFNGNYTIYSLEGYSNNSDEIMRKLNFKKIRERFYICILVVIIIIIISLLAFYIIQKRKRSMFREIKILENTYLLENNLFR